MVDKTEQPEEGGADTSSAGQTRNRTMPETLGHYTVVSELGRGGMGTVYKAHEPSLNRNVAIKVLSPHLADDAGLAARFVREAQSIAALSHANIIHVYYAGTDQGRPFFVMEYVKGTTLAEAIRNDPAMAPERAARILLQAATGLRCAHDRGIVHRDIKPSNLMLAEDGTVKVADFGIALARDFKEKLTSTGQMVGTSGYISPEICQGRPADARSDIFSLGIVLYEMLSGQLPFNDESPLGMMVQVVKEPAPDVRALNARVDAPLLRILDRMIEKEPDDRYQTCHELVADLEAWLAGQTAPRPTEPATVQMQAGDPQQPSPEASRRIWPVALLALLITGGAAAGGWYGWKQFGPDLFPEFTGTGATATPPATASAESTGSTTAPAGPHGTEAGNGSPIAGSEPHEALADGPGEGPASTAGAGGEGELLPPLAAAGSDPDAESDTGPGEPALADTMASSSPGDAGADGFGTDGFSTDTPDRVPDQGTPVEDTRTATPVAAASDPATALVSSASRAAEPDTTSPGPDTTPPTVSSRPPVADPEGESLASLTPPAATEPATRRVAIVVVGDPAIAGPVEQSLARALASTDHELMDMNLMAGYSQFLDDTRVDVPALSALVRGEGASLLVVASITQLGDTALHYHGRSDYLYNARVDVRGYDLLASKSFGRELSSDISYTSLNASDKARETIAPLAASLAESVTGISPGPRQSRAGTTR